jgi:beta-mannanase
MPESWNEINEDDILNSNDTSTGILAKYDRIMNRKLRDSIINFTNTFNRQTAELQKLINELNKTHGKLSKRLFWLNIVLVFLGLIMVIFGVVQIYVLFFKHYL